jgi:hypothetical protein
MAVRLSALCAGRPLTPGRSLILISVRGCVDPRDIVRLEGLGQLKSPMRCSAVSNLSVAPTALRAVVSIDFVLYNVTLFS